MGVFDAKTKFSEVVAAAQRGEETLILRHGKPVAKVVPVDSEVIAREQKRKWFERVRILAKEIAADNGGRPISREEILAGIREGRRWED